MLLRKLSIFMALSGCVCAGVFAQPERLLNDPVDISPDFRDFSNTYYVARTLDEFNPQTGEGQVIYQRYEYSTRQAFNNMLAALRPVEANEFPSIEYAASPSLPFRIDFVSPATIRIRMHSGPAEGLEEASLMIEGGEVPSDDSWTYRMTDNKHSYKSEYGEVIISPDPWYLEFRDAEGNLLTRTHTFEDNISYTPALPFAYVRRAADYSRSFNAALNLQPGEKIYGCGESFTRLDKRGQRIVLWTDDANGVQNETMYKPIPFYMSSKGYGLFMHTSTPVTCDFGASFHEVASLMIGDNDLDLFVFLGKPKQILDEYTDLTGKSPMPPLWSFGLWMSRITYFSQEEGIAVADNLRINKVPADVIHFDTGWFETDWRCDYKFSENRFEDPEAMIDLLREKGFHISLWQLPYFVPKNELFDEIIDKGLHVKAPDGGIPYEDAILDFSNPETVGWYQDKIAGLLKMGVGAIKVDFGEAAPLNGIYESGKTGFYEHNLYPLRYNKTVADITLQVKNEHIIWARSTWAGSQRYPVHWGGDAANTNSAMLSTLRGGLSLGLSGFAFWSHDIGGFTQKTPEELYRRWMPFGMLTSHSRCHGTPPKEPWEYSDSFLEDFRKADELKYKLMPYVYAQAKECSEKGLPMVRALFVEFPDDPGSWLVEDEYLFGSDILVAPLFESNITGRDVYLPEGQWIDYQTGKAYTGGWHHIEAGDIPVVMLVREGTVLPHIKPAQSTRFLDWSELELKVYAGDSGTANGLIFLPDDEELRNIEVIKRGNKFVLSDDVYKGKVKFKL